MIEVLIVGTVHEEKGRANVTELFKILEVFHPNVLFLEIPTIMSNSQISEGLPATLESKSVELYCQKHPVELVPVDLPTPELKFFKEYEQLHKKIESHSREYCRLLDWHSEYVQTYGFLYLNSIYCDKIWNDLEQEIEFTAHKFGEGKYHNLLKSWNQKIELRDIEMLHNIRKYCSENTFERGMFLVGASHRRSIKRKIECLSVDDSSKFSFGFLETTSITNQTIK